MKKLILFLVFVFLLSFVSAIQVCQVYDDFSSGNLNPSKWDETIAYSQHIDEHYVLGKVFHMAQINPSNSGTSLNVNRVFVSGEIIEYDVNYTSGEGNRVHTINLDGVSNSWALFGFWNSIEDGGVGNEFGVYHVKLNFTNQGVKDEITLPNGTIVFTRPDGIIPSPGLNHTFGVVTRTGHNGIVHMDYDNFKLCFEDSDDDHDGIVNTQDSCPNTSSGSRVDQEGCSIKQFCGKYSLFTSLEISTGYFSCQTADWFDNENFLFPRDCKINFSSRKCVPLPNPN